MSKLCPACREKRNGVCKATIFANNGSTVTLNLCREHDRELFIMGQIKFTSKYQIVLKSGNLLDELLPSGDDQVFADIA